MHTTMLGPGQRVSTNAETRGRGKETSAQGRKVQRTMTTSHNRSSHPGAHFALLFAVLLVIVDTLRADRLGSHGNGRGLTPNLDRLGEEGIVFENASSHAPWTLPATASLLTSLHPLQHGAGGHVPNFTQLVPKAETAASIFAEQGYTTASIINVSFLGKHFGLDRGFAHLDEVSFENNIQIRDATQTTDAALTWLQEHGEEPFFLLVHYFDPHAVYDPPQPFRRRFALPRDREDEAFVFGTRQHMMALRFNQLELEPSILQRAEALYDGEVAYADHEVGRLLNGLDELGLRERVCVVATSDHGEEFLDHDGFEHGHSMYQELLHVPLLMRAPGLPNSRRVSAAVRHIDVLPTLCELTGIPPRGSFEGISLVPAARGAAIEDLPAFAHGNFWGSPLHSWRDGLLKLIATPAQDALPLSTELFEWKVDPHERTDLSASRPDFVERMTDGLRVEEERILRRRRGDGKSVPISEDHLRFLQDLGYAQGGGPGDGR